ncbi:MAG: hypothetical protein K9J25_06120 [Bacteroidales bacterium]|nr:hypothetical protein [Bacteroidales bacterium]
MKRKKIRRVALFLLLGVLFWLIIDLISDWEGNIESFKKGYNEARKNHTEENR